MGHKSEWRSECFYLKEICKYTFWLVILSSHFYLVTDCPYPPFQSKKKKTPTDEDTFNFLDESAAY